MRFDIYTLQVWVIYLTNWKFFEKFPKIFEEKYEEKKIKRKIERKEKVKKNKNLKSINYFYIPFQIYFTYFFFITIFAWLKYLSFFLLKICIFIKKI